MSLIQDAEGKVKDALGTPRQFSVQPRVVIGMILLAVIVGALLGRCGA